MARLSVTFNKDHDIGVVGFTKGQTLDLEDGQARSLSANNIVTINGPAAGVPASVGSSVSGAGRATLRAALLSATQTGLMSTPPTITVGGINANSTVVTDIPVWTPPNPPTSASFSPISGKIRAFSAGNYGGSYITEQFAESCSGWGYGFSTDGEAIEICFRDVASSAFRFRVREPGQDWKWVSLTDTAVGAAGANFRWIKLDFGGISLPRDIEVYCHASNQVRGLVVGPSAGTTSANNKFKIWATESYAIRAAVFGDSYTAGTGASSVRGGYVYVMGDALGVPNIVASGVGGQGYIANSNNSAQPFTARLADVSALGLLDWVDVAYGINDLSQSAAALTAAVVTALTAIKTEQPNALITVSGPWTSPGKTATAATEAAIKAGFDSVADLNRMAWIPTISDGWQDTSATAGNMTQTAYGLDSESPPTHVDAAGHVYLGLRRAAAVRKALLALTA